MVQTAPAAPPAELPADPRPTLWRDPAYHGMNFTQFFGAFNDNLFKQLVLLICVSYAANGPDYQQYAAALFALPFVLFSGFAGFLADRISKQQIVVAMKVAEIVVMLAGFAAFYSTWGRLVWLMCVVFLMGTHSAFFGPA
jgi:MFS family permease